MGLLKKLVFQADEIRHDLILFCLKKSCGVKKAFSKTCHSTPDARWQVFEKVSD